MGAATFHYRRSRRTNRRRFATHITSCSSQSQKYFIECNNRTFIIRCNVVIVKHQYFLYFIILFIYVPHPLDILHFLQNRVFFKHADNFIEILNLEKLADKQLVIHKLVLICNPIHRYVAHILIHRFFDNLIYILFQFIHGLVDQFVLDVLFGCIHCQIFIYQIQIDIYLFDIERNVFQQHKIIDFFASIHIFSSGSNILFRFIHFLHMVFILYQFLFNLLKFGSYFGYNAVFNDFLFDKAVIFRRIRRFKYAADFFAKTQYFFLFGIWFALRSLGFNVFFQDRNCRIHFRIICIHNIYKFVGNLV